VQLLPILVQPRKDLRPQCLYCLLQLLVRLAGANGRDAEGDVVVVPHGRKLGDVHFAAHLQRTQQAEMTLYRCEKQPGQRQQDGDEFSE
jgi:hypothetical protein